MLPRNDEWSGRERRGPTPPSELFSEPSGKACMGARRLPVRFRWGLRASKGPSWWNTASRQYRVRSGRREGGKEPLTEITRDVQLVDQIQMPPPPPFFYRGLVLG